MKDTQESKMKILELGKSNRKVLNGLRNRMDIIKEKDFVSLKTD